MPKMWKENEENEKFLRSVVVVENVENAVKL